jgi:hypothetical protein
MIMESDGLRSNGTTGAWKYICMRKPAYIILVLHASSRWFLPLTPSVHWTSLAPIDLLSQGGKNWPRKPERGENMTAHPARLEPHSAVYAASSLPMYCHRTSMDSPRLRCGMISINLKILLHKCHIESTVAALKRIVLCNRVACPNSLVQSLTQQLRHKCGVARHMCGIARRGVEWCGVARNAAFHRNVQAFVALCGLFAYSSDLRHMPRC